MSSVQEDVQVAHTWRQQRSRTDNAGAWPILPETPSHMSSTDSHRSPRFFRPLLACVYKRCSIMARYLSHIQYFRKSSEELSFRRGLSRNGLGKEIVLWKRLDEICGEKRRPLLVLSMLHPCAWIRCPCTDRYHTYSRALKQRTMRNRLTGQVSGKCSTSRT